MRLSRVKAGPSKEKQAVSTADDSAEPAGRRFERTYGSGSSLCGNSLSVLLVSRAISD